jgi:hypothetical protein
MFEVNNEDTLKVSGTPVDPTSTPLSIVEGWNWIGFTPQVNININDALGQFNPNPGDLIKSQFSFSMYDELMGWVGTLEFLRPGQGYKYKYKPQNAASDTQQLYYPQMGSMLKSTAASNTSKPKPTISTWSQYQNNMSIVAVVEGTEDQNENDVIKAYADGELRGKASPMHLDNGTLMYFMTVYGNTDTDTLSFTFTHTDKTYKLSETIEYAPTSVKGDVDSPFVFNREEENEKSILKNVTCDVYPNPFEDEFTVSVKHATDKAVDIKLVNVIGETVKSIPRMKGKNINATIKASECTPGVYFAVITINGTEFHKRIIKK